MSGVERLREAVRLMRERAQAAIDCVDDNTWEHKDLGYNDVQGNDFTAIRVCEADTEELAEFIAAWPPAIALAVADWLDHAAGWYSSEPESRNPTRLKAALAVADAYLGLAPVPVVEAAGLEGCACTPCPGRGNDGHGLTHCAECCFGTGVIADIDCPIHGQDEAASSSPGVGAVGREEGER